MDQHDSETLSLLRCTHDKVSPICVDTKRIIHKNGVSVGIVWNLIPPIEFKITVAYDNIAYVLRMSLQDAISATLELLYTNDAETVVAITPVLRYNTQNGSKLRARFLNYQSPLFYKFIHSTKLYKHLPTNDFTYYANCEYTVCGPKSMLLATPLDKIPNKINKILVCLYSIKVNEDNITLTLYSWYGITTYDRSRNTSLIAEINNIYIEKIKCIQRPDNLWQIFLLLQNYVTDKRSLYICDVRPDAQCVRLVTNNITNIIHCEYNAIIDVEKIITDPNIGAGLKHSHEEQRLNGATYRTVLKCYTLGTPYHRLNNYIVFDNTPIHNITVAVMSDKLFLHCCHLFDLASFAYSRYGRLDQIYTRPYARNSIEHPFNIIDLDQLIEAEMPYNSYSEYYINCYLIKVIIVDIKNTDKCKFIMFLPKHSKTANPGTIHFNFAGVLKDCGLNPKRMMAGLVTTRMLREHHFKMSSITRHLLD